MERHFKLSNLAIEWQHVIIRIIQTHWSKWLKGLVHPKMKIM